MPWIVGGAILGSAVLGGIGSSAQQKSADRQAAAVNAFNAQQAQLNRDFQADQAVKQMEFQERMSNTGYQRGTKDMLAAGLNPMLAYSQGPASSPSGAQASGAQASGVAAPQINRLATAAQAVGSLGSLSQQAAQTDQIRAQTSLIETQRSNIQADTVHKLSSAGHSDAMAANVRQEMTAFVDRLQNLREQTMTTRRSGEHMDQQARALWQRNELEIARDEQNELRARARELVSRAELLGLEVPKAVAEAALWKEIGAGGAGLRFGSETLQKLWPGLRLR